MSDSPKFISRYYPLSTSLDGTEYEVVVPANSLIKAISANRIGAAVASSGFEYLDFFLRSNTEAVSLSLYSLPLRFKPKVYSWSGAVDSGTSYTFTALYRYELDPFELELTGADFEDYRFKTSVEFDNSVVLQLDSYTGEVADTADDVLDDMFNGAGGRGFTIGKYRANQGGSADSFSHTETVVTKYTTGNSSRTGLARVDAIYSTTGAFLTTGSASGGVYTNPLRTISISSSLNRSFTLTVPKTLGAGTLTNIDEIEQQLNDRFSVGSTHPEYTDNDAAPVLLFTIEDLTTGATNEYKIGSVLVGDSTGVDGGSAGNCVDVLDGIAGATFIDKDGNKCLALNVGSRLVLDRRAVDSGGAGQALETNSLVNVSLIIAEF